MKKLFFFIFLSQIILAKDASWIGNTNSNSTEYQTLLFRKQFTLNNVPATFPLFISADLHYKLFVNEKLITYGPSKGDHKNWYGHTIDIAKYLLSGVNIIAVEVVNRGQYKALSEISNVCGLYMKGSSKESEVVSTDNTWKVQQCYASCPILDDHITIGAREHFMASYYPWGWQSLVYSDANWATAQLLKSNIIPVESPIPLLTLNNEPKGKIRWANNYNHQISPETYANFLSKNQPISIGNWSKFTLLYDQTYLTNAYPVFTFSGLSNARITIKYAEALSTVEKLDSYDLPKGNRDSVENKFMHGYFDEVIPSSKITVFSPSYYRTFRYMLISISTFDSPLTFNGINIVSTGFPFEEKGKFQSSDSALSKIWEVGIRTAKLCATDTYMDCPYFEQMQYIGDTRIQGLISLTAFGDDRLIRKALNEFKTSMGNDSLTKSRYPDNTGLQIIPPFSLFYISMLHDLMMYRPSNEFIKEHITSVDKILAWHRNRINRQGLLGKLPYWNFIDWTSDWKWVGFDEGSGVPVKLGEKGECSIHLMQYLMALQKASFIHNSLENKVLANKYTKESEQIKAVVKRYYWNNELQIITDFPYDTSSISQHAQALAILTGLCDEKESKRLVVNMFENPKLIQASYYYKFYMFQALKKANMGNLYLSKLEPWHKMIANGLTTFAEKDEPTRSDCHAWSASPVYDFLATVLGVEPSTAGFSSAKIQPNLGSLSYASGIIPTSYGDIKVSYKKDKIGIVKASIYLPKLVSGELVWKNSKIKLKAGNQVVILK